MIWIIAAIAIALLYVLFVRWQMTFPVCVAWHQTWSPLLRLLLPRSMRAISLWRTCWLLYPPGHPYGRIGTIGRIHYLWESRRGYAANKYEEQARAIAGEPSRIVP